MRPQPHPLGNPTVPTVPAPDPALNFGEATPQFDAAPMAVAGPAFESPPEPLGFDLGSMGVPELLHSINPNLMDDLSRDAPQVMSALMKQTIPPAQFHASSRHASLASQLMPPPPPPPAPQHSPPAHQQHAVQSPVQTDFANILDELSAQPTSANRPAHDAAFQKSLAQLETITAPPAPPSAVDSAGAPRRKSSPKQVSPRGAGKSPASTGCKRTTASSPFATSAPNDGEDSGGEDVEVKKAMRAERNRQSAAASRERKKHHIKELERRVSMLSAENAQLQVEQLQTIRSRIEKERELLQENRRLKEKVVSQSGKIEELTEQLKNHGIEETLKRPSTWAPGQWSKKP